MEKVQGFKIGIGSVCDCMTLVYPNLVCTYFCHLTYVLFPTFPLIAV